MTPRATRIVRRAVACASTLAVATSLTPWSATLPFGPGAAGADPVTVETTLFAWEVGGAANNVVGAPDAPTGFGSTSIAASGDGSGKTDIGFVPADLFGRDITLGEIASMSYWTKKATTHAVDPADWYITLYTAPYDGDVSSAAWYGDRIGTEPYFSMDIADPAGTWNQWSTDASTNRLRFFESTAGAPGATFGSYTDPDWAGFLAESALSGADRGSQTVQAITVQTGSAWSATFTGSIDGLVVELTDGSTATFDFEADPPLCTTTCYVDAATGNDAGTGDATDPKQTIGAAVTQVSPGGTVVVAPGTYAEDVALTKSVTLSGAGADSTTILGQPGGAHHAAVRVQASGVVVEGFTITRTGNDAVSWNDPTLNSAGVAIQGQTVDAVIRHNRITGNRTAIDVNNSDDNVIVDNIIDANHTGLIFRNETNRTTLNGNVITDNRTVGVLFLDASGGDNVPAQSATDSDFSGNVIADNWYGQVVDRQAGAGLPVPGSAPKDFSANWFGTTEPAFTTDDSGEPGYADLLPVEFGGTAEAPAAKPEIAGAASANVDVTPLLTSGTDTDLATPGFQPDTATLLVVADGAQTGSTGRIDEGIARVDVGGTVQVADATFTERVAVTKSVTVSGAGADATTIMAPEGSTLAAVRVLASGVTVEGFTITRAGNDAATWNDTLSLAGVAIQGQTVDAVIRENRITGNRTAIDVNNSDDNVIVDNVIDANHTGLIFRNQTANTTLNGNVITDNRTVGVLFLDASGGTNSPLQTAAGSDFSGNVITGNWYAQVADRQTGGSLPAPGTNVKDFSANWFGTTEPAFTTDDSGEPGYAVLIPVEFGGTAEAPAAKPEIAGAASANVDVTPLLTSGADTDLVTPGFQPDTATLLVVADGAQNGSTGRIDEGIARVDVGGTVDVATGTYGAATVTKPVALSGAGIDETVIDGSGTGTGLAIGAGLTDVSVSDLTVTDFQDGITLTTGPLARISFTDVASIDNARHGIWSQAFAVADLSFVRVDASRNGTAGNAGRGLWVINGEKSGITVVDGTFDDNGLVGIDISDGNVTGLTISGNTVTGNGDSGIGVLGATGPDANLVSDNTVEDNGRYGIEIKNSTGTGTTGPGSVVVSGNTVRRTVDATDARDHAGIAVFRRAPTALNADQPSGVVVDGNAVTGFTRKPVGATGDGFGIVVEGTGHVVTDNVLDGNDVAVQVQAFNVADQQSTPYFDRGNAGASDAVVNRNVITTSGTADLRNLAAPTIDATCNAYDAPTGPVPAKVVGGFVTSPFLIVQDPDGVCGIPTDVEATAGDASATVTWEAPAPTSGAPITGYLVTAVPGGQTCVTGSTSCTVTGLTNGTQYRFTVTGTNATGPGQASALSNRVRPTAPLPSAPGAPTNVAGVPGDGQIVVTWSAPPAVPGPPITGYTVVAQPGGSTCTTTGALTCTITGLTNGTPYTISVTASNTAGVGPASAPIAPVTPVGVAVEGPVVGPDFTPVTPVRVFDTRPGQSPDALRVVSKVPVGGDVILTVRMTDLGGVVPADGVAAVSLNVAVDGPTGDGFLTVYPCGPLDLVASVTYAAGETTSTGVIAPVSGSGDVCFASSDPTDVIVDLNGWFSADGTFHPIDPSRLFDTRPGESPDALRTVTGGPVGGDRILEVQVTDLDGLVPADGVGAVSLTVTATGSGQGGYLTAFPCGELDLVATVNFAAGQTVSNAVISPISDTGTLCFAANTPVDVVVDINGWFESVSTLRTVGPARVFDTRPGESPDALRTVTSGPIGGAEILEVQVTDLGDLVPASGVQAVVLNLAVTNTSSGGFVAAYPCGDLELVASLNHDAGETTSNMVIVPVSADGTVCFASSSTVDLVADITGWFGPVV